jgi:chromosome segregation ATPase
MDDSISVMEIESKEDKLEISMLQYELKQRNEKIEKMQEDFTTTCNERDGLRQTLSDLTEQHASYKKKSETLSDRLGYMNASLLSMMQQQEIVLNATKAREEQWENLSKLRREKLKSLVYLEEQDASEEVELRNCLIKQNQEMAAMKATIATVQHQHTGFVA